MKERPILFSAPMVRALLDGRKTQTRRAVKLQTGETFDEHALVGAIQEWRPVFDKVAQAVVGKRAVLVRCPYGKPGDRLWVRESFRALECGEVDYFADGYEAWGRMHDHIELPGAAKWKPSIHMPRAASRITLEITGVRVERLRDISRGDAMAEGCPFANMAAGPDPRSWYADLWGSINGPTSWAANPWVWVIEFKRIKP